MTTQINYSIGIIGIGILGTALKETFLSSKFCNISNISNISNVICYDKYKNIGTNILDMNGCDIIFLCLPTEYDEYKKEYNKQEIYNVIEELAKYKYKGIIIIKSTIEPETTVKLANMYKSLPLHIINNPEFLSARTATEDFKNQKQIILGIPHYNPQKLKTNTSSNTSNNMPKLINYLETFFSICFPLSKISICSSTESESIKLFCNSFYATKVQYFTEIKLLCDKLEIDYNNVKNLMLLNGWINPMHTDIPGHDGQISFGGKCFPKDIKALNQVFKNLEVPNRVLESVITENSIMRDDNAKFLN